jgi:hypothetical protein
VILARVHPENLIVSQPWRFSNTAATPPIVRNNAEGRQHMVMRQHCLPPAVE